VLITAEPATGLLLGRVDTPASFHYDTKRSEKEIAMTTSLELVPAPVEGSTATDAAGAAAGAAWVAPAVAAGAGALAAVAALGWLLSSVALSAPVGVPGF
jgi:hypothetical protein